MHEGNSKGVHWTGVQTMVVSSELFSDENESCFGYHWVIIDLQSSLDKLLFAETLTGAIRFAWIIQRDVGDFFAEIVNAIAVET